MALCLLYFVTNSSSSAYIGRSQVYSFAGARPVGQEEQIDGQDIQNFWDRGSGAAVLNQLNANYTGVLSPVDTSLAAGEQTVYQRYWNVFFLDTKGLGFPEGKLVQIVVRWREARPGGDTAASRTPLFRQVTTSFFKADPTRFNQ